MDGVVTWLIIAVIGINLTAVTVRLLKIERKVASLQLANRKLDFLLKQSGAEFNPFEGLSPELADALRDSSSKIEAIMRYRKARPVGLAQAKREIEAAIAKTGIDL